MDRLRMETPDMVQKNIEAIGALFPNCVTEARGEDGAMKRAVNFDMLRQMLTDEAIAGDEAYEFTWVGKKEAMVEASRPIRKTLRPCKEESKDWDTTENLYIEGDNLDVLKLLQESYLGKVKMIYIDPPYNTGHDFIYRDNFARSKAEEERQMGMFDEETEEQLFENTESNGRFHSDWCSMMYPRLKVANNLLSDDGIIFISIDDNEIENMRFICNELFGEQNFIAQLIWQKKFAPQNDDKYITAVHDYILVYARNKESWQPKLQPRTKDALEKFKNPDNDPRGVWTSGDLTSKTKALGHSYAIVSPSGKEFYPPEGRQWAPAYETYLRLKDENRIWFGEKGDNVPRQKQFLNEIQDGVVPTSFLPFEIYGHNQEAKQELKGLMPGIGNTFETPKPIRLMIGILNLVKFSDDDVVLDFFSGSASTAHAVMKLNQEDGIHRKFIMIQIPEYTSETSEAYKAGYRTICDIGKERIRRAGEKIKSEAGILAQNLDIGFRVLKLDESNMKDVYYSAATYTQEGLSAMESNIKEERSDLDLLYGCLLAWALPLSLPYCVETINGCTVHTYGTTDPAEERAPLKACFDEQVPESVVRAMAAHKPLRVVFRDSSFASSPERINVEEIFKLLAPNTSVRVI